MAKKFMFVCAGILMLAGAFAIGARSVEAQVGDQEIVSMVFLPSGSGHNLDRLYATTAGGDVYYRHFGSTGEWVYWESIFGGMVSSENSNLGGVKSQYR